MLFKYDCILLFFKVGIYPVLFSLLFLLFVSLCFKKYGHLDQKKKNPEGKYSPNYPYLTILKFNKDWSYNRLHIVLSPTVAQRLYWKTDIWFFFQTSMNAAIQIHAMWTPHAEIWLVHTGVSVTMDSMEMEQTAQVCAFFVNMIWPKIF